ncbi:MAG: carbonic anhydrase, partial [Rhodopirellula sp. JB053]
QAGTRLMIDASGSDYIDPDVLSLIRDYKNNTAPARDVKVNLVGFRSKYQLRDDVQFADYTTRELQDKATADQVITILREGNRRFVEGTRLNRDLGRQVNATAIGQNPLAAVLSCIDSRVPTELVFDLGVGDIFSVRVAGNIVGTKSLGSLEYAVGVAGVKLVVVLGHTRCGAVTSSVKLVAGKQDAMKATGCEHLQAIVDEIAPSIQGLPDSLDELSEEGLDTYVDNVAKSNVIHTAEEIIRRSQVIRNAVNEGRAKVIGALYDVKTGKTEFFGAPPTGPSDEPAHKSFADSPH